MTIDKKSLSERDICTKFITPSLLVGGSRLPDFLIEK